MFRVVRNLLYFSHSFDPSKNYYRVLNVSESATPEAIKSSYKTLAKQYHPDFNKGKEQQFKEVNEAYQILSDEASRRQYDQTRVNNQRYSHMNQGYRQPYRPASSYPQDPRHSAQNQWRTYQEYYNSRQQSYQQSNNSDPRAYHNKSWNARDQYMYEFYKQQQTDFFNRFHETQRQRFDRGRYRSPIEEEYMRRFMEELAMRQQMRRMKEQEMSERQAQQRIEKERQMRQYEQSKQNLKRMSDTIKKDASNFFKGLWNAFLQLKSKK